MKSNKKWVLALGILATFNPATDDLGCPQGKASHHQRMGSHSLEPLIKNVPVALTRGQAYAGTVYKWADDNGVSHYTNTPRDPEPFEERKAKSFEFQQRKQTILECKIPEEEKLAEKPKDFVSKTRASDLNQVRRIVELAPDQIDELIEKTWAYIQADYAGIDLSKRQSELRLLVAKLRLNFDIKKSYKTRLREQFKEVGILFWKSKGEAGRFEYVFGDIIEEFKIDAAVPATMYSTDGFVGRQRPILGFAGLGEIFINESAAREQVFKIYDYSKQIRRLRGPFRLICRHFLNYRKTTDNLTRSELVDAYLPDLIEVIIAHERAHIYDSLTKGSIEKKVIACLGALRDIPTLSALYYALTYAHPDVQKDVRKLFEEYGYDPNSLYSSPVEDISKVAGKILKKEFRFCK